MSTTLHPKPPLRGIRPFIVAAIPAYDEEKNIAKVITSAKKYVDKVIVCDDGSQDMTAEIASALGAEVIRHTRNMGKGEALRSLFLAGRLTNADIMVTLDSDGQHDPSEIPELVDVIRQDLADVVIGARFSNANKVPSYRKIGNRFLNMVTAQGISDTQSGFRAYSRRVFESMLPAEMGMGADSEILMDASKRGFRIAEVPISVKYGIGKTSTHNPLFHTLDVLSSAIKLTSMRHPLIFYGVPGAVSFSIGLYFSAHALMLLLEGVPITNVTMTYELIGFAFILLGLLMGFTGIILFTLITTFRKGSSA